MLKENEKRNVYAGLKGISDGSPHTVLVRIMLKLVLRGKIILLQ